MLPRAAAEAAAALLLGGALATRGWEGLTRFWDYAIPYGALFLCVELILRRKAAGAARVFFLGAAFACVYEGVYTKSVMDGLGFLGTDTAALAAALFDWGMLAVMAAHLLSARWPRPETVRSRWAAAPAAAALAALTLVMIVVYLLKTAFGHYVVERAIAPTWLVSDLLFLAGAYQLFRRALDRDEDEFPGWVYALCGFATWAPGNEVLIEWGQRFAWPGVLTFMLCASWASAAAWGFYRLWRWRGVVSEAPVRVHPFVVYAAVWRVVGSIVLLSVYRPGLFDSRVASAYAVLVDLPTRLAFSYALLSSRLDV
jgi:hypothetical protein